MSDTPKEETTPSNQSAGIQETAPAVSTEKKGDKPVYNEGYLYKVIEERDTFKDRVSALETKLNEATGEWKSVADSKEKKLSEVIKERDALKEEYTKFKGEINHNRWLSKAIEGAHDPNAAKRLVAGMLALGEVQADYEKLEETASQALEKLKNESPSLFTGKQRTAPRNVPGSTNGTPAPSLPPNLWYIRK